MNTPPQKKQPATPQPNEIDQAVTVLRNYQAWRRGADIEMAHPKIIGHAIDTVLDDLAAERKRCEELAKDAARYRYIKENQSLINDNPEDLDAAIDAAISASQRADRGGEEKS